MADNTHYSTPDELNAFVDKLTSGTTLTQRPMLVLDMDGNFGIGYRVNEGKSLPLNPGENPEEQGIPSGANVKELLAKGIIEPGLFAQKVLDVRVPEDVARLMNENIAEDANPERKFDIVVLTSRNAEALLKILKESGIEHPENLTLVADSGANIYVGGKRHDVRSLDTNEKSFLSGLEKVKNDLEQKVDAILTEKGFDPANRPKLFLEQKTIANNIHWRTIMDYYGQPDGSELDQAITSAVKSATEKYVAEKGPKKDGKPVFLMLDGPCIVEVKVGAVNKGEGLRAVIEAAKTENYTPSAIMYSGDDVSKIVEGKPSPGTEHAAFVAAPKLQEEYGIPIYTAHTQHPVSKKLGDPDAVPTPELSASNMGITPDIIVPDPKANAELVVNITERAREKAAGQGTDVSWQDSIKAESAGKNTKRSR